MTEPHSRPPLHVRPLLEALGQNGVDFVVVGGVAGLIHGSALPTYDLDIAYGRDEVNLRRLAVALGELEVRLRNAPADLSFKADFKSLVTGANFTFDTEFGEFDVLGDIAGNRGYDELRTRSWAAEIEGVPVRVVSIDDLIGMKNTAGRPKDRIAVEELVVIADLYEQEEEEPGR